MKKLAALIAVAFAFAVPLAGCNTMKGAGQDIQKGGQKMEDAARRSSSDASSAALIAPRHQAIAYRDGSRLQNREKIAASISERDAQAP